MPQCNRTKNDESTRLFILNNWVLLYMNENEKRPA